MLALPLAAADFEWAPFFEEISAALSEGNAKEFLRHFDPEMEGYADLERTVRALVGQYAVGNEIEKREQSSEGGAERLELDWFLEVLDKDSQMALARRREWVKCTVAKQGRRWRITQFTPLELFRLPGS